MSESARPEPSNQCLARSEARFVVRADNAGLRLSKQPAALRAVPASALIRNS
jgi:hypothetical protein